MGMTIDKDAIEKRLKRSTKKVYSFRLDAKLADEVQRWCDDRNIAYSALIEELFKEFLDTSKKKK